MSKSDNQYSELPLTSSHGGTPSTGARKKIASWFRDKQSNNVWKFSFSFFLIFVFGYSCFLVGDLMSQNYGVNKATWTYAHYQTRQSKIIPKILYRTSPFPLHEASSVIQGALNKILVENPAYVQVYFDDMDCEQFVADYFPEYKWHYSVLVPGAYKADFFRLLVIYKWGGIYHDIGHSYLVPMNHVWDDHDEFISATEETKSGSFKHALHNSILGAYPKHPIIKFMIDETSKSIEKCAYYADPLDVTGPAGIGRAFNTWMCNGDPNCDDRKPIRRGTYRQNDMMIKLLSHDPRRHMISYDGKDVISTKFPGYVDTMYKNRGLKKYEILWKEKHAYKNNTNCANKDNI